MLNLTVFSEESMKTAHTKELPVGNHAGIWCRFTGTNDAGQTIAHSDLGVIEVTVNGDTRITIDAARLKEINDNFHGAVESTSTTAGAFALSVFVPFEVAGFPNSLTILPQDAAYIKFTPGANVATRLGANSGTLRFLTVESDRAQVYALRIGSADRNNAASQTSYGEIPQRNVYAVLLGSLNARNDNVRIRRDGDDVFNGKFGELVAATAYAYQRETATLTYGMWKAGRTNAALVSQTIELEVSTSSAGTDTVYVTFLSIDFNAERTALSQNRLRVKEQSRLSKSPAPAVTGAAQVADSISLV